MAKKSELPHMFSKRNGKHALAYGYAGRTNLKLRIGEYAVLKDRFAFRDATGKIIQLALKDAAVPVVIQNVEVPNVAQAEVHIDNGVFANLGKLGNTTDLLNIYINVPEGHVPNVVIEGYVPATPVDGVEGLLRDSDAIAVYSVTNGTVTQLKKSTYGAAISVGSYFQIAVMGHCYTIGDFK